MKTKIRPTRDESGRRCYLWLVFSAPVNGTRTLLGAGYCHTFADAKNDSAIFSANP